MAFINNNQEARTLNRCGKHRTLVTLLDITGESLVKDILQNLSNSCATRRDSRRRNGSSLLLSIFPKHLLRDANFTKQLAALTSYRSEIEGGYPTAGIYQRG